MMQKIDNISIYVRRDSKVILVGDYCSGTSKPVTDALKIAVGKDNLLVISKIGNVCKAVNYKFTARTGKPFAEYTEGQIVASWRDNPPVRNSA